MSSRQSYGSSFAHDKAYGGRSTSPRSTASSAYSSSSSSSIYANTAQSSRNFRYGTKSTPVVIHNGGGSNTNTGASSSASDSGYHR
ncbi:hypothetical protein EJ04DRAFT_563223 [Polyplosphaeria fusca]|uniref:Uncharacterized protein n=1 Tax=Polyplosphaeria fusca TaxID=682080 RepID=A0A9P4QZ40_9PLEO|nr:hypothetical protein EJ04DRAFT_563223 [Polyplosphaeria fusca]